MKASPTKDAAHSNSHSSKPFFSKNGEGGFFSPMMDGKEPFFSPATIQPKLTIGPPNDKYEQEADDMAEKVSRMPMNNGIQAKCDTCRDEEDNRASIQTKPIIQRTELEKENSLQMEPLMKTENVRSVATPELTQQLRNSKGRGSSLSDNMNNFMSRAFGNDFSKVRIHSDSEAIKLNQSLNSQAVTHGTDIYFNKGKYNPSSNDGRRLLAHELTHVVQQGDKYERKSGSTTNRLVQQKIHKQAKGEPPWKTAQEDKVTPEKVQQFLAERLGYNLPLSNGPSMEHPVAETGKPPNIQTAGPVIPAIIIAAATCVLGFYFYALAHYSHKSDDWLHCYTSCKIGTYCSTLAVAILIGLSKEVLDYVFDLAAKKLGKKIRFHAEWKDVIGNLKGVACAPIPISCTRCCSYLT